MLVTQNGDPIPPQAVISRLRGMTPPHDLRWIKSAAGPYWALTKQWSDRDPRRERIQSGEIPASAAWDIEYVYPGDMPADSIASHVEANYGPRQVDDVAKTAAKMMKSQAKDDEATRAQAMDAFLVDSEQKVKDDTAHQRRLAAGDGTAHPMVAGFGEKTSKKKATKAVSDVRPGHWDPSRDKE